MTKTTLMLVAACLASGSAFAADGAMDTAPAAVSPAMDMATTSAVPADATAAQIVADTSATAAVVTSATVETSGSIGMPSVAPTMDMGAGGALPQGLPSDTPMSGGPLGAPTDGGMGASDGDNEAPPSAMPAGK
jgi:hypothetical protein